MRVVVLVDGDHHPSAVRAAIDAIRKQGNDVVGAVFCGGGEKVDVSQLDHAYGVPACSGADPVAVLQDAIERFKAEGVLDLADDPVVTPELRSRLAVAALAIGVTYGGGDFQYSPPAFERILTKPTVRVFATGKRSGKTAVASALARHAMASGKRPVIVAQGRGGTDPPRVIEAGTVLAAPELLRWVDDGLHAASDYIEDALTSGATTIGCMRVGGGIAGATYYSNAREAARIAEERPEDFVILEASGGTLPDVEADAGILCVTAGTTADELIEAFAPLRLLLADVAVVTMAEEGTAAAETEAAIHGTVPDLDVVRVVFRPEPLAPISGRRVFFCCTALPRAGAVLKEHLERTHGCDVVGMTHRLANRSALSDELSSAPDYDVLLTELKAGAVDLAVRHALKEGKDVVFVNNAVVGDGIDAAFDRLIDLAVDRSGG